MHGYVFDMLWELSMNIRFEHSFVHRLIIKFTNICIDHWRYSSITFWMAYNSYGHALNSDVVDYISTFPP